MSAAKVRADLQVELADGTAIGYTEVGDPGGRPLLFFHGTPGSRLWVTWPTMRDSAEDLGIRLLGLDRPGVGLSAYLEYTVADYPSMVRGFADALGLHRFAVMGFSSGAKYACACGWALPDRVTRVVLVSTTCSNDQPGATAVWTTTDRIWNAAADRAPWLIRLIHDRFGHEFRNGRFPKVVRAMLERAPADKAIMERADFMEVGLKVNAEGYRQGGRGLAHEDIKDARPWGFPLDEVRVPVEIWQGGDDMLERPERARILAAALPHATLHVVPGEGHLSMGENQIKEALRSALATD